MYHTLYLSNKAERNCSGVGRNSALAHLNNSAKLTPEKRGVVRSCTPETEMPRPGYLVHDYMVQKEFSSCFYLISANLAEEVC